MRYLQQPVTVLFVLFVLYAAVLTGLPHFYPYYIHSWTQSDRLALAYGYLDNGMNLFLPQTQNLYTTNGITAADLPLAEYVYAAIMKLLHTRSPLVVRLVTFAAGLVASYYYFRMVFYITQSRIKAGLLTLGIFTCPVIYYFQMGMNPSVIAFNLLIVAFYFLVQPPTRKTIVVSVLLLTLASCVRATFMVHLLAVYCWLAWQYGKRTHRLTYTVWVMLFTSIILLSIFQWYKYAMIVQYGSLFLSGFRPAASLAEFFNYIYTAVLRWWNQYHSLFLYAALIYGFIKLRKSAGMASLQKPLPQLVLFLFLSGGFCFLLMSRQFHDHEYYYLDSFMPALCMGLPLLVSNLDIRSKPVYQGALWVLLLSTAYSFWMVKQKQTPYKGNREHLAFTHFKDGEKLLNNLNIPANARILVLGAYTTNLPLILLNRKGYTVVDTTRNDIREALSLPYNYICIQNLLFMPDVVNVYDSLLYRTERVGGNGHLSILRKPDILKEQKPEALLGFSQTNLVHYPYRGTSDSLFRSDMFPQVNEYTAHEYGITFTLPCTQLQQQRKISCRFSISAKNDARLKLVCSVERNGKKLFYQDYPAYIPPAPLQQKWLYAFFPLPELEYQQGDVLKIYAWNPEQFPWLNTGMEVSLFE